MTEQTPQAQPEQKKFNWKEFIRNFIMIFTIISLLLFAFAFGRYAASCEISSIEQYINAGGKIIANATGLYDFGMPNYDKSVFNNTIP